ncbi:MAG: hypothetical protein WB715_18175 [Roseiarcus sp.]|uniref:hypothetical protein n=1 Tax=Roseiarcus sp. TaxID=1969460 RepID=UPI003C4867D2
MFFRRKRPPSPLSDLFAKCTQEFIADFIQTGDPDDEQKRAQLLIYLIVHGAYGFIDHTLNPDKNEIWSNSNSVVNDRNKDVLIAETAVWLCFLMGLSFKGDNDDDKHNRVGYLTLPSSNKLLVSCISDLSKVDFSNRAVEARRLYRATEKERGSLHEVFANRLLASLENMSLAEGPIELTPAFILNVPIEVTERVHLSVATFFAAAKPLAIYETFKNALHEFADKFPWG